MSFFKNIFKSNKIEEEYEELNEREYLFASGQLGDDSVRKRFVDSCIAQMKDSSDEIDVLNREYDTVTSLLNDMDEIERLPKDIFEPIKDCANRIVRLEKESRALTTIEDHMSESDYQLMERFEPDMPAAYDKIKSAEDYQKKVKSDMNKLEGEKQALFFRRRENVTMRENLKGLFFISLIGTVTVFVLLLLLKIFFDMEILIAFLVTAVVVAFIFVLLFIKITDAGKEFSRLEKTIGKIIEMHNTVKIRYVNNTNLLDYLYMKYEVDSSGELKNLWERYLEEKAERDRLRQTMNDIGFSREELYDRLKNLHITDPSVWKMQPEALINHKEMVEIRHGLITRRQVLRKQIEINSDYAKEAEDDLKELVRKYPQYSVEVMKRLEEFENKERF